MATQTNLQIVVNAKDNASATLRSVGSQVKALGDSPGFNLLEKAAKGAMVAITALGAGAVAAGVAGVKSAADFEQTKIALTTMMGSADKAGNLLERIAKFAAATPFEMPELATATKQLMAFGFSADDAYNAMAMLGDISAGLNVPLGDLAYLLGTLKAQGRAFTIDIRQFAMRGLPIYEELGKVMGASGEKLNKMIEDGKVGFPEVSKALQNMTAEGGRFYGSMVAQSTSLSGLYSTLSDNMGFMLRQIIGINLRGEVREGSIFDLTRKAAAGLINWLDANKDKIADFIQSGISKAMEYGRDWIDQMGGPQGIKDKLIEVAKNAIEFGKVVIQTVPPILKLVAGIANLVEKVSDFIDRIKELKAGVAVFVAIAATAALFNPLSAIILGIGIIIKELIEIVKALVDIFKSGVTVISANLQSMIITAQLVARSINREFGGVPGQIIAAFSNIGGSIKNQFGNVESSIGNIANDIRNSFRGIGNDIANSFGDVDNWIQDKFGGVKGWMNTLADKLIAPFKGIGNTIADYFGGVGDAIRRTIQPAIDFINKIIAGYNRVASKVGKATIPEIRLAFGGGVEAGRPVIVGEYRPEVFVPSQSGNIKQLSQVGAGTVNINFNNVTISSEADENRLVKKITEALTRENNLGYLGVR